MLSDRRTLRWLNGLLGAGVLAVVCAVGWAVLQSRRIAQPRKVTSEFAGVEAHWRKAREDAKVGRRAEAEYQYLAALSVRSDSPNLHLELAQLYDGSGDERRADAHYQAALRRALQRGGNTLGGPVVAARYGDLCLHFGRVDEARSAYRQAIVPFRRGLEGTNELQAAAYLAASDAFAATVQNAGGTPLNPKDRSVCERYLRRALAVDPYGGLPGLSLAWRLYSAHEFDRSRTMAAELEGKVKLRCVEDRLSLATLMRRQGQTVQALRTIQTSLPYFSATARNLYTVLYLLLDLDALDSAQALIRHADGLGKTMQRELLAHCEAALALRRAGRAAEARAMVKKTMEGLGSPGTTPTPSLLVSTDPSGDPKLRLQSSSFVLR